MSTSTTPISPVGDTTTTTVGPRCQGCQQPIRPDETAHVCPAPDGTTWHMHASVAQCLARLTGARLAAIVGALARP